MSTTLVVSTAGSVIHHRRQPIAHQAGLDTLNRAAVDDVTG